MNGRAAAAVACACACLVGAAAAQNLAHDVPQRGAHVYARSTERFDVAPMPSRLRPEQVVADGLADVPHRWRYRACSPQAIPQGFEQPGFDDSGWPFGQGEFGPDAGSNGEQRTTWREEVLCLRTTVALPRKPRALVFLIDHDDGVRVWLNGRLLVADDGFGRGRLYIVTDGLDAWQAGDNLLAAQCTNTGGAQYFDLAMAVLASQPPGLQKPQDLARALREEREQTDRVRRDLFGAYRPPPLLLHGELDAQKQAVAIPPGDLRELAWWLAMDLRQGVTGGPVQAEAFRMFRLGDVAIRGRASAVEPDGWQTLDLVVKTTPEPVTRGDSKRYLDRHVRPFVWYGFDGTLQIRRRLEVRDGRAHIAEFRSNLDGRILRGKDWRDTAALLRQRETWRWQMSHDNQDAAFRAMVARAIERGTARLREDLRQLGGPDLQRQPDDAANSYHTGRLALGLLALVKGGVPKDDEVVQRGFQELRSRRLIDTYSLANAIMAIEALYAPASEAGELRAGALQRPRRREPSPGDRELLARWTAQLLANVDTRVDPAYLLRFNYTAGPRFDNSVNQYGLLGLYSAHLCGIEVKPLVWEAAANHLLASQSGDGAKVSLDLVDYRTLAARQADPEAPFTQAQAVQRALGWSYHEPKVDGEWTPTWGSMTCAGITGLAICEGGLLDHPQYKRPRLLGDSRRARDDGFAWLAQWMTPRQHAGAIERQQQWIYYYLYSLERAALLSGVALIQGRDWYFEGAMVLVLAQQPDGHWPGELLWDLAIERDAMAILFLKQSTAPVVTGR